MIKKRFAFEKSNYILLVVGVAIIIVGFLLMMGPGSTMNHFEPDIFSMRRIVLAPAVCFFGFIFIIYAIMHRNKSKNKTE